MTVYNDVSSEISWHGQAIFWVMSHSGEQDNNLWNLFILNEI